MMFRYSPIHDEKGLWDAVSYIHSASHRLCHALLGNYLPVAGNIGIFCHGEEEFLLLTGIRERLTNPAIHWNHKYYALYTPFSIARTGDIPEATYRYLYIRKPENAKPQVGDLDFYVDPLSYKKLKQSVLQGQHPAGVSVLERPDLDLIQLSDPALDVLAFVGSYDLQSITT